MKITIEFDSAEQAVAALRGIGPAAASVAPPPAPAPYAPPQQPYQPPAAAPVYAPPAPAAPVYTPPPQAPVAAASGGITIQQLAQAAQAYAKVHTPKGAKAKLAEFGLTKINDTNPAQYATLLQALAV